MASKKPMDQRVRAFVASVLADCPENEHEHIDDIECDMEELADAVANEFIAQRLARRSQIFTSPPPCPDCGQAGRHVGDRKREILTTRGSAPLVEPKCYCPACRRYFFPSVQSIGPCA